MGLSAAGDLYWGSHKVASGVTSMSVRAGGAGGPALLFITRTSLLYTVYLTQVGVSPKFEGAGCDPETLFSPGLQFSRAMPVVLSAASQWLLCSSRANRGVHGRGKACPVSV